MGDARRLIKDIFSGVRFLFFTGAQQIIRAAKIAQPSADNTVRMRTNGTIKFSGSYSEIIVFVTPLP